VADSLTVTLNKEKELLAFRVLNLADVSGPESHVSFER